MAGKPTHGGSYTKLYKVWTQMRLRCTNPNNHSYHNYGARGITVCQEWGTFPQFEQWAHSSGYEVGLTLDRIDNNSNYEPNNCRWTTREIQASNQRKTVLVTAFGDTKPMHAWVRDSRCIVSKGALRNRILSGWEPEKAMSTPGNSHLNLIPAFGESKPQGAWAKDPRCKCKRNALDYRLKRGWNPEDAISTPADIIGNRRKHS